MTSAAQQCIITCISNTQSQRHNSASSSPASAAHSHTHVTAVHRQHQPILMIFERQFAKRFALCYRTVVCHFLSLCRVCDVGVLWRNGWMDQNETWHGGRPQPYHNVRWGPSLPQEKRGTALPQFSVRVCCGQTTGWIKTPLGTEVGLGPGDIVLDGDPDPPKSGTAAPSAISGPCLLWPNGCMDQDATW